MLPPTPQKIWYILGSSIFTHNSYKITSNDTNYYSIILQQRSTSQDLRDYPGCSTGKRLPLLPIIATEHTIPQAGASRACGMCVRALTRAGLVGPRPYQALP